MIAKAIELIIDILIFLLFVVAGGVIGGVATCEFAQAMGWL